MKGVGRWVIHVAYHHPLSCWMDASTCKYMCTCTYVYLTSQLLFVIFLFNTALQKNSQCVFSFFNADVFLPSPDSLLVNLKESKDVSFLPTHTYMYIYTLHIFSALPFFKCYVYMHYTCTYFIALQFFKCYVVCVHVLHMYMYIF